LRFIIISSSAKLFTQLLYIRVTSYPGGMDSAELGKSYFGFSLKSFSPVLGQVLLGVILWSRLDHTLHTPGDCIGSFLILRTSYC